MALSSRDVVLSAPRMVPFSVSTRLEYLPMISQTSTRSQREKSPVQRRRISTMRSNSCWETDKISAPRRCLRKSMQKLGATGAGSFSVADRQTRALEAFVLKTSLTVDFPVYIIRVTSSLSAWETRLIFPPFKAASSSAAERRIWKAS